MSRLISIALACVVLFVAFCSAQAALDFNSELTETQLRNEFGVFVIQYERDYATAVEYETRYEIFKANVLNAQRMTKESSSATFGVTKFSDFSTSERQAYLGKLPADRTSRASAPTSSPKASPTSFDMRKAGVVPPVKNQGKCGSCWAFSTVYGIESAAMKAGIYTQPLSPQQLVDCCAPRSQCDGCDGGDLPVAYNYLSNFGGIQSEASYPYTAKDGKCKNNSTEVDVAVKGFEWIIPTCQFSDCDAVDSQLFLARIQERGESGAICVAASNAWFDYTGGVFDLSCSSHYYSLNHCVGGIVEYDRENGWVSIQNSWGEDWGLGGLMKLKYDPSVPKYNNMCGIFSEGAFAKVGKA